VKQSAPRNANADCARFGVSYPKALQMKLFRREQATCSLAYVAHVRRTLRMNIEQMSTGCKRSLQRLRLKLAILLFFAPFLVILRTQSALGQALKTQLNAPGNTTGTFPFGVNTSEAVVGSYVNTSGATSGFLYTDGKYTTLDYPGSHNFTRAGGINDFNEVVGYFLGSDNSYHGYTYVGGAYRQYDVDKAVASTSLFGINNAGHLVGSRVPLDTLVAEGFTDTGGFVTSFYGSGTNPTYAYSINNFDETVGMYYDSSNKSHGFYRDARGTVTEIAYPGASQTACVGINDAGEITGNYVDISGISHGFTEINGKFATTDFYSATGVNSEGVFVGYYFGVSGVVSGYLASTESFELTKAAIPKQQLDLLYGVNNPGISGGNYVASNGTPPGMTIASGTVTNVAGKNGVGLTPGNPGGSPGDIQFNNAGTFGGSPDLFWDKTNGTVTITKTSTNSQSGLDVTVPTGQDNQYSIRAFTTAAHHSALTADVVIGNGVSTRDAIIVSGTTSGSGTSYAIKAPTSDPTMLALWSDVTGPAAIIASSAVTLGNNLLYGVLDGGGGTGVNKFYTLEIDPYGSYFMGSSTNTSNTGWDTGFSRLAAGVTAFGNGTRLNTSGTVETTNFVSVPRGTATGSTQFSSGTLSLEGSYWTGSASNTDAWNITASHASSADAAQVLTITPTNPQAQTSQMNLNAALVLNSGSPAANSLISLTDANSNIGFFSNNNNPQGVLSWNLDNGTRKWVLGTNFLTTKDFEFSNGSRDLVVINHASGAIGAPAYISAGTTFTATGCGTPTSLTGGPTAGSFLAQATSCTVTVTMGNLVTAPDGWSCSVWDVTTTAKTLKETAYTTATVTFSGTVAAGDKIIFGCTGF
jgi:hypothetical protein